METQKILQNSVIIIDPMQIPDGRERLSIIFIPLLAIPKPDPKPQNTIKPGPVDDTTTIYSI